MNPAVSHTKKPFLKLWIVALGVLMLSSGAGRGGFSAAAAAAPAMAINPSVADYLSKHPGKSLSVIVQARTDPGALESYVRANGGRVSGEYTSIEAFSATVSASLADRLNHDPRVLRLNLNAAVKLTGLVGAVLSPIVSPILSPTTSTGAVNSSKLANRYEQFSGIPSNAWNQGFDGSNVQVAVLDTGVFPHDDLTKASPAVPANGGNRLLSLTTNSRATDALDHFGHGTHVAGIVAGNGYDSGGKYLGVAPNSLLVSVKISDDLGNLNEGDVINGLEWVYQANKHGLNIRVANLSLASTVPQSYNYSALDAMVEKLWSSGVAVVTSSGAGAGSVLLAPGNDPFAITVGSVDDYYQTDLTKVAMAAWSPYGVTQDAYNKPELVTDGSHVVSLAAPGSYLLAQHLTNLVDGRYFLMGGTSMAAPQVAGVVALMLQANPNLSPDRIKGALVKRSSGFSSTNYTSWLGTTTGFLNGSAVPYSRNLVTAGSVPPAANVGTPWSYSFSYSSSTNHSAIVSNGLVLIDADWGPGAAWNSTAWNSTAWNSTAWNSTSWNSTAWDSTAWDSTAWNSTAWNSTTLNSTAWNSTSWNSTSWNSTSWDSTAWNSTSWNSTAWNSTAWNSTSWNSTAWNSTAWNSTAWNFSGTSGGGNAGLVNSILENAGAGHPNAGASGATNGPDFQ
jgi:serine protease AprX